MSFSVIVSVIIIIVAVSAAASFVLRDNEGRIKPALAVLSLVLAGFAAVLCAYGSENGTIYAKADGDPQETVRQFFDAVCAGNYSVAYGCLENYGSLGLENSPSTETGELVYAALRESYAYELLDQAEVDKLSARQRVSFTYLNLPAMEEDAAAETESVLEKLVRSRPRKEVYDENDNYLPAVTDEAYKTAITNVLKNADSYRTVAELTVALDYVDGRWLINADSALLSALMGGAA